MVRTKRPSGNNQPLDALLSRIEQVLADPPADRTGLLAEYFVLAEQYTKLHHQLYKTLAISDTYQQQMRELSQQLEQYAEKLQRLREIALPICMYCHKIRTDDDYWQRLETYFSSHVDIMFSHGICPDCVKTTYSRLGVSLPSSEVNAESASIVERRSRKATVLPLEDEALREMKELVQRLSAAGDPLTPELVKIADRYAKLLRRFNKTVSISDSYQFQLHDLNMRLELMVRTDILTGLANRMEMMNQLEIEQKRSERHGKVFSLLLGDIDYFKQVNDNHGHLAGDRVLRQVAARLREQLRSEDVCARWGGEEFMILLPETPIEQAMVVGNKLADSIRDLQIHWDNQVVRITMSFGVGQFKPGSSIDSFTQQVDDALYLAKHLGRDRVESAQD